LERHKKKKNGGVEVRKKRGGIGPLQNKGPNILASGSLEVLCAQGTISRSEGRRTKRVAGGGEAESKELRHTRELKGAQDGRKIIKPVRHENARQG